MSPSDGGKGEFGVDRDDREHLASGASYDCQQVVLRLDFDMGHDFIAQWHVNRSPGSKGHRLTYVVVDQCPPTSDELRRTWGASMGQSDHAELVESMIDQWPPLTPNLHRLAFDNGRVQLLLAIGAARHWLPELVLQANRLMVGAADSSADTKGCPAHLSKALARLASPGATLAGTVKSAPMRHALASAGFKIEPVAPGAGPGEPMQARFAPDFRLRGRLRQHASAAGTPRQAVIIGAGLAGCAAAWALAEHGWHTRLLDRNVSVAQEGSGNLAGLFHGIVNPQDGVHARFNRAAALEAQRAVRHAIEHHGVRGQALGLLRLETSGRTLHDMRQMLQNLALPHDYVQALDVPSASQRAGLTLRHPAWFYPGGGWVDPAGLALSFRRRAGAMNEFRGSTAVHTIRQLNGLWHLFDVQGRFIDRSRTLILANACDAMRLLGAAHWPVQAVRGQLSLFDPKAAPGVLATAPKVPLAGDGYVLPSIDGVMLFGATSQAGDGDPLVRTEDHEQNLQRLQRLGAGGPALRAAMLHGRVGWRCVSDDRLPLLGAAPDEQATASRYQGPRWQLPRHAGLYVFTALGSRGIAWAAMGGQVLASMISGAAVPIESSLVDAVDPARFAQRAARRVVVPDLG